MTELHRKSDFRFFHRLRVRWAEVDMQKIVFNAHYLMYFDTAIADYWRAMALPYEEAMRADARKSTVALRTYRSPPIACIDSSYGSASARQ